MSAKEKECSNVSAAEVTGWKAKLLKELKWNKKLVTLKMVLFFFHGGSVGFLPFLTLHMQQLGITVQEIAIIYSFLPIASLLGPPTSGIFADKFGRYKMVLVINCIVTTVLHCMLLYVPSRPRNSLTFACGMDDIPQLTWESCDYCHEQRNGSTLNLILQKCHLLCENPPSEAEFCFQSNGNSSSCHTFSLWSQIPMNGTLSSIREADTCSHQWQDLFHKGHVFHGLSCLPECPIECQVIGMPHCDHPDDPSNAPSTFWIYFVIRIIATFFLASAFTMLDATVLAVIKVHGGDFGKQRVLNMIGQATVPLVSGILVDYHSRSVGYSDYMPSLYLGAALNMVAVGLIFRLHFTVDKAGKNILSDLKKLVTKPEVDLFLIMILVLGSNWGFIESYLFVYLIQLNAPNYMLGLTLTVGCLVGVPVMYVCDKIVAKIGRHLVFIISFMAYTVRQFGYAYINDPWLVFPFEMLEVFTYQIMWVAAVTFCPILAPKGLLATMTGVAGAVHYSVGRGIGALLGGYLISRYGITFAFNFFGYLSISGSIFYTIVYFAYLRKKTESREKQLEAEKSLEKREEGISMIEKKAHLSITAPSKTEDTHVSKDG